MNRPSPSSPSARTEQSPPGVAPPEEGRGAAARRHSTTSPWRREIARGRPARPPRWSTGAPSSWASRYWACGRGTGHPCQSGDPEPRPSGRRPPRLRAGLGARSQYPGAPADQQVVGRRPPTRAARSGRKSPPPVGPAGRPRGRGGASRRGRRRGRLGQLRPSRHSCMCSVLADRPQVAKHLVGRWVAGGRVTSPSVSSPAARVPAAGRAAAHPG